MIKDNLITELIITSLSLQKQMDHCVLVYEVTRMADVDFTIP